MCGRKKWSVCVCVGGSSNTGQPKLSISYVHVILLLVGSEMTRYQPLHTHGIRLLELLDLHVYFTIMATRVI